MAAKRNYCSKEIEIELEIVSMNRSQKADSSIFTHGSTDFRKFFLRSTYHRSDRIRVFPTADLSEPVCWRKFKRDVANVFVVIWSSREYLRA